MYYFLHGNIFHVHLKISVLRNLCRLDFLVELVNDDIQAWVEKPDDIIIFYFLFHISMH